MPTAANAKLILLNLINQIDGSAVSISDVEFENPQRAPGTSPLRNTRVKVTTKQSSDLYGSRMFWYNRVHVSELGVIQVDKGSATTHWELLPAISEKYGIVLSTDDIVDAPIPANQTGLLTVALQINNNSLMFYSGYIIVTPDYTSEVPAGPPISGTLLNQGCVGVDLVGTYADGSGGTYTGVIEANSVTCGYVAPTTTPPPTPSNVATIVVTPDTLFPSEGEEVLVTYTLSNTIPTSFSALVSIMDDNTDISDYADLQYSYNNSNNWFGVPLDGIISVPENVTHFKVRAQIVADLLDEPMEYFSIVLNVDGVTGNITNSDVDIVASVNIFAPTIPQIIAPSGMDLFKAATGVNRATSQSNSLKFSLAEPTGIFSRYVVDFRQYFEISILGALSPTSKVLIGVATMNAEVDSDYTVANTTDKAMLLDIRTGRLYTNNTFIQTSIIDLTSSSVLGVAIDPTFERANYVTLSLYLDGAFIGKYEMVSQTTPQVYGFVSCNDPSITINVNTGETAFAFTVPQYHSAGMGKVPDFFDDYENNNKNFTAASLITDTCTVVPFIDTIGSNNQELTATYNEAEGCFDLSYLLPDKPVSFTNTTGAAFSTDIRLTLDFEYQDGSDLGGGAYTPSFFSFIADSGSTGIKAVTTVYNRDTDGSQKIKSGSGALIEDPTITVEDSTLGAGVTNITIPFSGRHKVVFEVRSHRMINVNDSLITKKFYLWLDDVLVSESSNNGTIPANDTMRLYFTLGNCGTNNKLHSYRIDEFNPVQYFNPSAVTTYDNTFTPLLLSAAHTTGSFILDPDNLTVNVSGAGLTTANTRRLYYHSYYWEYHVLTGAPSGTTKVAIASTNILDSVDPINDTDSIILSLTLPALITGDVVGVTFDPITNGFKIIINGNDINGSITIQSENAVFVTSWIPVFIQETATTAYTVKAIFEETELTYPLAGSVLKGIKVKI